MSICIETIKGEGEIKKKCSHTNKKLRKSLLTKLALKVLGVLKAEIKKYRSET